jgi:hypothetical protein
MHMGQGSLLVYSTQPLQESDVMYKDSQQQRVSKDTVETLERPS